LNKGGGRKLKKVWTLESLSGVGILQHNIWEMRSRSHTQRYVMVKTIEGK